MAASANISGALNKLSSLQCTICLGYLTKPKLLDCAHTFCISCLKRMLTTQTNEIQCPVCRKTTNVPCGNVEGLRTNLALKSVLEDIENLEGMCDVCKSIGKPKSLSLCYDCGVFMCISCDVKHGKDNEKANHKVEKQKMRNVSTTTDNEPRCAKHPNEMCTEICISCNERICKQCKDEHLKCMEKVMSTTAYVSRLFARTSHLQKGFKEASIECRHGVMLGLRNEKRTRFLINELLTKIDLECNTTITNLNEQRLNLKRTCENILDRSTEATKTLVENMNECSSVVKSVSESTEEILESPFQNIQFHDTFFTENTDRIEEITYKRGDSVKSSNEIREIAEQLRFKKSYQSGYISIGSMELHKYNRGDISLSSDKMTSTAVHPNGKVAVGYFNGGIELLTENGSEGTILEQVKVLAIAWFKEGDLGLRDIENEVSIYNTELKKTPVRFETLGHELGGEGDIAINTNDQIYLSYRHTLQIHIFTREGGRAMRVISCPENVPQQILATHDSKLVVMDASVIRLMDEYGNVESKLAKRGYFGYPAISKDGSIFVAWVKEAEDLVQIERYTRQLKPKYTVLKASLGMSARKWYKLLVLSSDKIFFCSPNNMYYFRRHKESFVTKVPLGYNCSFS